MFSGTTGKKKVISLRGASKHQVCLGPALVWCATNPSPHTCFCQTRWFPSGFCFFETSTSARVRLPLHTTTRHTIRPSTLLPARCVLQKAKGTTLQDARAARAERAQERVRRLPFSRCRDDAKASFLVSHPHPHQLGAAPTHVWFHHPIRVWQCYVRDTGGRGLPSCSSLPLPEAVRWLPSRPAVRTPTCIGGAPPLTPPPPHTHTAHADAARGENRRPTNRHAG